MKGGAALASRFLDLLRARAGFVRGHEPPTHRSSTDIEVLTFPIATQRQKSKKCERQGKSIRTMASPICVPERAVCEAKRDFIAFTTSQCGCIRGTQEYGRVRELILRMYTLTTHSQARTHTHTRARGGGGGRYRAHAHPRGNTKN